jgi:hypothetical protein
MRLRLFTQTLAASAALAGALALTSPASAQNHPDMNPLPGSVVDAAGRVYGSGTGPDAPPMRPQDPRPEWRGPPMDGRPQGGHMQDVRGAGGPGYSPEYARARDEWLAECRRNHADDGVGGALIGGVVGGVLGNRIAGRHDRTLGTIAGAAVGAIAGSAIDRSEDRNRVRDYCESYLERYSAQPAGYGQAGYGQMGYAYTYAVPMMMVPVAMHQNRQIRTETIVTEEWVTVRERRHRYIPARRPIIHDKRVRIAPAADKRVPIK